MDDEYSCRRLQVGFENEFDPKHGIQNILQLAECVSDLSVQSIHRLPVDAPAPAAAFADSAALVQFYQNFLQGNKLLVQWS